MVREGRVLIVGTNTNDPDFGSGCSVTAYEVGAQVHFGSTGNSITVRPGHGLEAGDKFMLLSGANFTTTMRTVDTQDAVTITMTGGEVLDVSQGDFLINLGADTGSGDPNYDGSNAAVYSDMSYNASINESTVTTDANGRYSYYHQGISIWELVRTPTGVPNALYQSASEASVSGPDTSTTDNAVALFDGTDGVLLKQSVVQINSGAMTGITTLATSGAVDIGGALEIGGALTGVTTLTASGSISAVGSSITGTSALGTITASGTLAVTSTSAFTGAVTLTGGVAGAMTATGNVTSGGHLRGAGATVALTGNAALVTTDRVLLDITNTSGTNTGCTLTAPSSQDGQILVLRIAAITNGSISVIESTTASLVGTEWTTPGAGDTLTLIASGSVWYEIARSNN